MSIPIEDPFGRFLCQVESWQRREARWKKLFLAATLIALVTLAGAGVQFMVAWQSMERLEQATAESYEAREELATFRKQWQEERESGWYVIIGTGGFRPTPMKSSTIWVDLGAIDDLKSFQELKLTGKDAAESPGKDSK